MMSLVEANEKLMPGSLAARGHGCTCPPLENRHGMGWVDLPYQVRRECPLHGEKKRERE